MSRREETKGWHLRAGVPAEVLVPERACKDVDTAVFFPEGRGYVGAAQDRAKAICAGCPVRVPCRDYGLGIVNLQGIFGGLNEEDRRKWRRRDRARRVA